MLEVIQYIIFSMSLILVHQQIVPILARIEVLKVDQKRSGTLLTCSTTIMLPDNAKTQAVVGEATVLIPKIVS
jgi:hypothetical protein